MRRPAVADPVAPVLLALAAILASAKLGGDLAERIGQPAVLGELVVGILLGNLDLVGVPWFRGVASDHTIDVLARLGVVLLLFEVGLESTVGDMLKVGGRSLLVAVLGVVTPGCWAGAWGRYCSPTPAPTCTRSWVPHSRPRAWESRPVCSKTWGGRSRPRRASS